MAKAKKTAPSAANGLRGGLPPGQAKKMMNAFYKRMDAATDAPEFPEAVVHTIEEIRAFLDSAEKTINPNPADPVPVAERGIAIIPGYSGGNVTYMLVATRFTADPVTRKIITINNPVTGIHIKPLKKTKTAKKAPLKGGDDPTDPPVGDDSFDTGNSYP
ncbi:MAG: hypothetical protein JO301_04780 [Chitinophagaceae bacterium]|nr:hypothetical protein [Chitinophagaceae bacterium]